MNLQTLLIYSPFLALVYVLYALLQALRGKRQGVIAALLAFIAMAASLAAYVVTSDAVAKAQLVEYMVINAAVVFVVSLLILLIERRRADRDMNRSYGMLGIGLSILLALGIFITPLISRALPTGNFAGAAGNNRAGNSTLQTVSALTPGAAINGTAQAAAPSQVAQVLSAQTGLSVADLTTQLTGGSTTIAQLVSANNGNLDAVTAAIATALDQMNASGGQAAALISRLGTDTTAVATQIVQGQLQGRSAQFIIPILLTGSLPQFGGGNGTGGFGGRGAGGNGGATPQVTAQAAAPVSAAPGGAAQVTQVLSAQTGLSVADLTTKLAGGSTIAQLVSASNGDLNVVTTAIASALDQINAAGGRGAQVISTLGTDTTAIANQVVQGQLQGRAQQFVIAQLLGSATTPAQNGSAPTTPPQATIQPTEAAPISTPQFGGNDGGGNGGATPDQSGNGQNNPPATAAPTVDTVTNTPTTERPTPIVFPTATPTPIAAETTTQATTQASASACTLIPNYDLNMRDKPSKETGSVLISIPLGKSVTANTRTSDGWYSVTYGGHSGWIDGTYASPGAGCASLPTATSTP